MPRALRILTGVIIVVVVVAALAWTARRPLSEAVLAQWLGDHRVAARYRIIGISPSAVTLADVTLGPSARPDFTAARVEARLGWSPFAPRLAAVTIVRPVVRATLSGGKLSFGSLDRLLPASTTARLPDIDLHLVDARVVLATAAGQFTARVDGRGGLNNGFSARGTLFPTDLAGGCCTARFGPTSFDMASRRDGFQLAARGDLHEATCAGGLAAATLGWTITASTSPEFDVYRASVSGHAERLRAGGYTASMGDIAASTGVTPLGSPLGGPFQLVLADGRAGDAAFRRLGVQGSYHYAMPSGSGMIDASAELSGGLVRLPTAELDRSARRLTGTLARPLLERVARRLAVAAQGFDATARIKAAGTIGAPAIEVSAVEIKSASGAQLRQSGTIGLSPAGRATSGRIDIAGGGLPPIQLTTQLAGPRLTGQAQLTIGRYDAPGAVLHDAVLDWRGDARGGSVDGHIRVSGAVGGGFIADQLALPIAVRLDRSGVTEFAARCVGASWQRLSRVGLIVDPAQVRLCPGGRTRTAVAGVALPGTIAVPPVALHGTYDRQPFALTSATMHISVVGAPSSVRVAIDPVELSARYGSRTARGVIAGRVDLTQGVGEGSLVGFGLGDPGLPVTIGNVAAAWRIADGRVVLTKGSARIVDRNRPTRFEPIDLRDVVAQLSGGKVVASGRSVLAATGADLLRFGARHDLAAGTGNAALTGTLTFGPALQPYQISERLRGIVANVVGPVNGAGQVDWQGRHLTSHGTLRIDNVALATAALGPVTGIDGTVRFDDLFALTTPPRQMLRIASINPGIVVEAGEATFQMLGPDVVAIAALRWPYAGGTLELAPVTIRAGDARRDLLLTVRHLDAALFLQRFDIKNIRVTGRFDGRLPLVFVDGKGRIVDGRLMAQAGGGLLQYVGEVGGDDLGAGAKLAFDALRRLRYRDLSLALDGDLDGELVTRVQFSGTNETAASLGNGPVPIRATGLPFKFNVAVRAPFRALLGTAASFTDVRPLINPPTPVVKPQ